MAPPLQDQRLVGDPSLCVHVSVGRHADVVSGLVLVGAGTGPEMAPWAPSLPALCFPLRPDGLMYQKFRNQFLSFSMYQSECLGAS